MLRLFLKKNSALSCNQHTNSTLTELRTSHHNILEEIIVDMREAGEAVKF